MAKKKRVRKPKLSDEKINEALWPLILKITDLELDEENANKHNEKSIGIVAASLREHGQQKPIWVQKQPETGRLIVRCGNGTLQGAKLNGWNQIAGVVTECSDADAQKFAITDNQSTQYSEFDTQQLATLLQDLEFDDEKLREDMTTDLWDVVNSIDDVSGVELEETKPKSKPVAAPSDPQFHVLVSVPDEASQRVLIDQMIEEGRTCQAFNV